MKFKQILLFTLILLIAGCKGDAPFNSHVFRQLSDYHNNEDNTEVKMVELKGDNSFYLARIFNEEKVTNSLIILSRGGKALSQINDSSSSFRSVTALQNPFDGTKVLFYSSNNGKYLMLRAEKYTFSKPLRRESKVFEPYWRDDMLMAIPGYKWVAVFQPILLDDIDGDGRLEVVVNASDSYSANPRGLIAYDYESGRQKWFVKSPACFSSVLFEDLDGDGHKEFILGTNTFKNTAESLHGIDDHNGFVVVVSRFGEVLCTEQLMEGTSEIKLQAKDIEQNGTKDLIALGLKRSSDGSESKLFHFRYSGKRLILQKDLELTGNQENTYYQDFVFKLDRTREYKILLKEQYSGLQLYDTDFNLLYTGQKQMEALLAAGDFLSDGRLELLFLNKNDELELLDSKLKTIAKMPHPDPGNNIIKAELFKPSGSPKPILMVGTKRRVLFYEVVRISVFTYIYRWIKAYSIWLLPFLLLIIWYLGSTVRMRTKSLLQTINSSERGFIVLNSKMRILFINKKGTGMSSQTSRLYSLAEAFPALVEPFQKMLITGANHIESRVNLTFGEYKLTIERLSALRRHYLILLAPLSPEADAEMLAWADTARRLSHHVRRHITNVLLSLDYLDDTASGQSREYLQIARSEIDKIRVFTHAFQRFTEMSSLDLKLIDIVPHIEHALKQAHLNDKIKLIKSFSTKSVHAYIEPVRFEEAMLNTINNATEAMPEGGTLHISIRVFNKHSSPKGALSVLVEVEDSGKGIPAKYMQDIWMPFFTTNQSGTGIGIPETKKILDSMGGILDIQSEEGVGTTVSLWLKGEPDA